MTLRFSMRPTQTLELRQKVSLVSLMQTQELLSIHPTALDLVLSSIELDPRGSERKLRELGNESDASEKVKSMFGELIEGKKENTTYENENSGFATTFPLKGLSGLIKKEVLIRYTPDVTYIGRKNEKPEIRYAKHLIEAPRLSLSLLDEFPESKKLYKLLSKEREWISSTLRDFYANLGNSQREFIYSLDPVSLHIYQLKDAAKELGFHLTTVSRLRKGRYISVIDSKQRNHMYPACVLMPNTDEYARIALTHQLNYALQKEAEEQTGRSDDWLSVHSGLARRTVTKYRTEAGIPKSRERETSYKDNPQIRYTISLDLEVKQ